MKSFTADWRRKFKAVSERKNRPSRPARLRDHRNNIGEALQESSNSSHASYATVYSENDEVLGDGSVRVESPDIMLADDTQVSQVLDEVPSGDTAKQRFEIDIVSSEVRDVGLNVVTDYAPSDDQVLQVAPTDEQSMREVCYLKYQGEDETDYTDGPIRFVDAFDGVKESGALLMNLDLSAKIQRAIRAQRDFERADRAAAREKEVILRFQRELGREIAHHEYRLVKVASVEEEEAQTAKAEVEDELSVLKLMLQEIKGRRQCIESRMQTQTEMLVRIQSDVNAYLEEAFVCGLLLEPAPEEMDTPVEELVLQTEYANLRRKLQQEQGEEDTVIAPLDTSREQYEPPQLSAEEEAVLEIREAYWTAQRRLEEAQTAFDRKENDRNLDQKANFEDFENGSESIDASQEDFDLRWVRRNQELTHELLEAEEGVAEAKRAAVDAGIDLMLGDQHSDFVDDVADGYRLSFEQAMVASAPMPKINKWFSGFQEPASPSFGNNAEETDELEVEDLDLGDSASAFAEGPCRNKIDKWRRICGF
ncbi:hypothetical protein LTR37_001730 [Vermiconidia calcicola]|uniref:Uncharacterized protein n=1 Tax=Vermiconidia calcicola TaxID=1690605 RepID=A0ACC3NXF3_9PEZI|nr:hypothetical protein LTR37_001730 [Vermiconidia calcicola]